MALPRMLFERQLTGRRFPCRPLAANDYLGLLLATSTLGAHDSVGPGLRALARPQSVGHHATRQAFLESLHPRRRPAGLGDERLAVLPLALRPPLAHTGFEGASTPPAPPVGAAP